MGRETEVREGMCWEGCWMEKSRWMRMSIDMGCVEKHVLEEKVDGKRQVEENEHGDGMYGKAYAGKDAERKRGRIGCSLRWYVWKGMC